MDYRSYIIEPSSWLPGKYEFHKGEGDKCKTADSESEAKKLIDELILESAEWPVKVLPHTEPMVFWELHDALPFIHKTNAVPLFEFNAP